MQTIRASKIRGRDRRRKADVSKGRRRGRDTRRYHSIAKREQKRNGELNGIERYETGVRGIEGREGKERPLREEEREIKVAERLSDDATACSCIRRHLIALASSCQLHYVSSSSDDLFCADHATDLSLSLSLYARRRERRTGIFDGRSTIGGTVARNPTRREVSPRPRWRAPVSTYDRKPRGQPDRPARSDENDRRMMKENVAGEDHGECRTISYSLSTGHPGIPFINYARGN